jgi:hypothetical protein
VDYKSCGKDVIITNLSAKVLFFRITTNTPNTFFLVFPSACIDVPVMDENFLLNVRDAPSPISSFFKRVSNLALSPQIVESVKLWAC